ncbi:UNKNOWN [Stylonychia lemnae]|uniref:Uncharacterized protein n=1 Tax=Stylonychia lemnae TaxID=5949 RepID=A0A077ZPY2_STYLE|nr:UNKNOWN [Stylonychia lemnae]|eukprot:CDW71440.1 UNKNOWN [Stylonychia lemnae]
MSSPSKIQQDSLLHSSQISSNPFNYNKFADMENEWTNEVLIDFIKHRCHHEQKKLQEREANLIQERNSIRRTLNDLEVLQISKEDKVQDILKKRNQEQDQILRLKKMIESNTAKINEKRQTLEQKKDPVKKLQEALETTKREVNEKNLKKVYNYLEKKNNDAVVYVMEALIGLMRGSKRADSMSVELYTKTHEGFMMGLNRIDITKLNVDYCQEHLDKLRDSFDRILIEEEFSVFRTFRNILSKLCLLAMLGSDINKLQQQIQKKEIENENSLKQIDQKEYLLKTIDVHEFIKGDIQYFETEQVKIYKQKEAQLNEEIKKVQLSLENFEDKFFADL